MFTRQKDLASQGGLRKRLGCGLLRLTGTVRHWAECRPQMRAGIRLCERELLLFPVAVTVLTGISFLFGGVCGAWQWWSCVAGVLTFGVIWGRQRKVAAVAAGGFLLFLGSLWFIAGIALDIEWVDSMNYHSPAMKLLITGWNPVREATLEALHAEPQPETWNCWIWHILAMPRGPWIFSAEAFFFTQLPYALCFPLFLFLFTVVAAQVWRLMRPLAWWARILAIIILWTIAPNGVRQVTDCAVFFGGVGVLAVMGRSISERRTDWTALVVFTFWLLCGKQIGLITGLFFWLCFAGERLVHARGARWRVMARFALAGSVVVALWGCVSVSPYWTMWRHYGHPLYPCYTANPERFPVYNIVNDFQRENADAAAMGHLGRFVNAYFSQRVAQTYYRLKLGQDTFTPRNDTWAQGGDDTYESSGPTSLKLRLHLLFFLTIALLFGRRRERWLSLVVILGMACVPSQMIGYTRYVPWWTFLDIIGLIALAQLQGRSKWLARLGLCGVFIIYWWPSLTRLPLHLASTIDNSWAFERVLDTAPPTTLYAYHAAKSFPSVQPKSIINSSSKILRAKRTTRNLQLLRELEPRLTDAQIELLPIEDERIEAFPIFPIEAFRLSPQEAEPLVRNSLFRSNQQISSRRERLCRYPGIFAQCLLVRLPALCYRRLQTLLPKENKPTENAP